MAYTVLYVHRFSKFKRIFALIGMALMRLPLWLSKACIFWRLMGCGKDATVHLSPDFRHWSHLTVWPDLEAVDQFRNSWVKRYFSFFSEETAFFLLRSYQSHGAWEGKNPFGQNSNAQNSNARVAILTRATIRNDKVKRFRYFTAAVHEAMSESEGFELAVGMGENPFNKQATFSVWQSISDVQKFAYQQPIHAKVISLTRQEQWYKEELFARFEVLEIQGVLNGRKLC